MAGKSADNIQSLDIMTFPLHGSRLIEASAGTGKTYTIAGLYLRLLLGHGEVVSKHNQALTVDQILVVTFTDAATEELRDRIRKRIHEARLAFLRGKTEDSFLAPFLAQTADHKSAANLLLNAERQMDEAAIFTIHGFCQRMLKQHAFESGAQFNNELVTDEEHLKAQVVADYWRQNFYSLPLGLVQEIRKLWDSPKKLLDEVGRYLSGAELSLTAEPPKQALDDTHRQIIERIDELKQHWLSSCDDYHDLIDSSGVDRRSFSKRNLPKWLEEVTGWAQSKTLDYSLPKNLERFSQSFLCEKTKEGGDSPYHKVFEYVEDFLAEEISIKGPLVAQVIQFCRARLKRVKEQRQVFSFDDLLTQLSAAIELDDSSILIDKIRQQYPVAMIDEFQDTDPLQYNIFSQIYLADPQSALLMIGDPKQAIYGFRGADIFTYIKAKKQVTSQYTLDTNWRSSAAMVDAVNQLFDKSASPFFYDDDIPFHSVNSSPGAELRSWSLEKDDETRTPQPALNFWLDKQSDSLQSSGDYHSSMADATASQIYTILTAAQNGKACLESSSRKKPIEASDIAVLVRNRNQAQMVKQALLERGIASVYLSNRQSVFLSPVAQDLLLILNAVLSPENERSLKACLASSLLALELSKLDLLNNDESAWEAAVFEFKEYRNLWHQRGFLPMLRSFMAKRQVAEQLLSREGGDRALTDLMHLGELLQQASLEIDSFYGLIHWLSQKIEDSAGASSEEHNQRLESENDLVQIVTIHKSKGLEYNLVFLPFACSFSEAKEAKYHDVVSESTVVDVHRSQEALEKAEKERLAEDLRLIYVALTRSVYGCYVGMAPIKMGNAKKSTSDVHKSAIGYLLQNSQEGDRELLCQSLDSLAQVGNSISIEDVPEKGDAKSCNVVEQANVTALESRRDIDRSWRLTSYSSLVKHSSHAPSKDLIIDEASFDIDSEDDEIEQTPPAFEYTIFTFPKGARPGTFLHTLFEQVDFNQVAESDHNQLVIGKLLDRENYDQQWLPVLTELVNTILRAKLNDDGMRLVDIPASARLVEMEFLLPIELLTANQINTITHQYDHVSALAGELGFHPVKGMLKGFIDLVFEQQGKYYVLDWKSNYLGDCLEDYNQSALGSAMADHRYDLQYQIYSLALHRYLKTRINNYTYEQHFGGVYYVFLRGVSESSDNGIFYQKPDYALIKAMDDLLDGNPVEAHEPKNGQMELDL